MLLSAVPCPGELRKGAKERPDPGKQPMLPASACCQRWEAGKVMHGLPTASAAGLGQPGRRLPPCRGAACVGSTWASPPFQHPVLIWVSRSYTGQGALGPFTVL